MRLFLALVLCKLTRFILRVMGRGGTALPGKIALAVCPDMLRLLSRQVEVVIVTGTNGKTTTCRMLELMLKDSGREVFANRSGSNLARGIGADFAANADLLGRPRRKFAVIECDEAAFRAVCGEIQPRAVVVTNVFRDQLDRYGEVTHTLECIRAGLSHAPEARVCLNADCSLTASLAADAPDRVRFYGMNTELGGQTEISDAPRCLYCGAAYEYDYHTFAHLGGFRCPKCGYSRPDPAVAVLSIDERDADGCIATLSVDGREYSADLRLPGDYNLYNAAAAVAAATTLGLSPASAIGSLAHMESGFGRMESFTNGDASIRMILVKNPAGCDRAIDYLASLEPGFTAVFCLNDELADGTDVSWIWDAGFERLFDAKLDLRLIVSGTRAEDMRLRLKYAGAEVDNISLCPPDKLADMIAELHGRVLILPTYTAMLPLRAALAERFGGKEFWK